MKGSLDGVIGKVAERDEDKTGKVEVKQNTKLENNAGEIL